MAQPTNSPPSMANPYIIIGGTFDPVHSGHIAIGHHLAATLSALGISSTVRYMPTPLSPLKSTLTATKHRIAMLKKALRNTPFGIERLELAMEAPVSSWDTFTQLRRLHPKRSIIFVMGQDSINTLASWKGGYDLLTLCNIWVVARAGQTTFIPPQLQAAATTQPVDLANHTHGFIYFDNFTPPAISSTELRFNLKKHQKLVNLSVLAYIRKAKLYCYRERNL